MLVPFPATEFTEITELYAVLSVSSVVSVAKNPGAVSTNTLQGDHPHPGVAKTYPSKSQGMLPLSH
jgi:hypothetical protein